MIVKLENIEKTYKSGVKALDKLNFEVREGEIYGLLGPNGCGKTTAINCLLSLLSFESGKITVFDEQMTPSRYDLKAQIGLVPQNVAVFDELTVRENIDYFCGLYVKDKETRKKYVEEAIDFVQLQDFRNFRPRKLSGGLLRRLNIACGIAHKPRLIIFDEPTVAVDPQSRNQILEGIVKLNEIGSTIIYTSHYMEEVEQICNYIVILDKGSVVAHGTKESLKEKSGLGVTIQIEILDNINDAKVLLQKNKLITSIEQNNNELIIKTKKGENQLHTILSNLDDNKITYGRINCEMPTLNDVFLQITGKELRD